MIPINYYQQNEDQSLNQLIDHMLEQELKSFAGELLEYGFNDMLEIKAAVERSMIICQTAGIPVKSNFKSIYISSDGKLIQDWLISELGRQLIIINADAKNPYAASIQIALLKLNSAHVKI